MSVRIRLQRHGRKQSPLYHIVIADARAPRDGSFIERIGIYNPMTKPATIDIDRMKAYEWMTNGAQPTETVRAILRFKGVLYYKHLQRGVSKGAMTPEDAEIKFRAWVDAKEVKIQERVKATADERKARSAEISGTVRKLVKKKVETSAVDDELLNVNLEEQAAAETADDVEVLVEDTKVEETKVEDTIVEETKVEETKVEETTPEVAAPEAVATEEAAPEATDTETKEEA